jgi:RND family efflux transporter MFP subunit
MEENRANAPTASPPESGVADTKPYHRRAVLLRIAFSVTGVLALVFLLLYLQGTLGGGKVAPGTVPAKGEAAPAGAVPVVKREIDDVFEWPGTVKSRTEAQPASKLMARIKELRVEVGTAVKTGDLIAVLDDLDVLSRLEQAKAGLEAAQAQVAQADAEYSRVKGLFEKEAATKRDLEAAEARAKSARAQVEQARHAVGETEVLLSETAVRAPLDGVVTEKWAQSGDTAVPGKPLLSVQDPRHLRLEASVPESCARRAALGMDVRVRIDSLGREMTARIEEISPTADPESRTFLVKAALPAENDLRPGMFGRFILLCGRKTTLLVPASALTRAGQLEIVRVLEEGEARVRHVRTGKTYGDLIEVLSGLREGDRVLPRGKPE